MLKTVSDIGEIGIINMIRNNFVTSKKINVLGIGDDAALIPKSKKKSYVITTDMLIEDIHFLKNKITPWELGYKALAVNLSDIAAMGGSPLFSLISISLPKDSKINWIKDFFNGYNNLSKRFNVQLIGGDTNGTLDRIAINVTVIGEVQNKYVKLLSTAQNNDILCLTGDIGESGAGLNCLLEKRPQTTLNKYLIRKHHMPFPYCEEGEFLSRFDSVTAMTDISDGLYKDTLKIIRESKVGAEIDLNNILISNQLQKFCNLNKLNPLDFALFGGEDYSLLITIKAKSFSKISKKFKKQFNRELYKIGKITSKHNKLKFHNNQKRTQLNFNNLFEHF